MFSVLGDKEALEEFGRKLRAHRLHRNLTQAHVAKLAGLSVPTLVQLEKGDGRTTLANVAKVLGVLQLADRLGQMLPEVEVRSVDAYLEAPVLRARTRRKRRKDGAT